MSQWQPIETIPDSGETVLVWCGRCQIVRADDFHAVPPPAYHYAANYTHWQPLPPPPQQEEGQNR